MNDLKRRALARLPLTEAEVEKLYHRGSENLGDAQGLITTLCESHERLRAELQGAEAIRDQDAARIELLENEVDYQHDWRQKLHDFCADSEQHDLTRKEWRTDRGHGVTLYSFGGFFTAYFDDAAELWQQADDTLPMFHVMVKSDPPHRTVIHPMHLAAWAQHLASICLPLDIRGRGEVP